MRISRLEVSGVRNISSASFDCNPGLNLFVGPNGAGKSALLEGIYILGRGRSFRTPSVATVVQRGVDALRIFARVDDEQRGTVSARMVKYTNGRSEFQLNGRAETRISEAARLLPIQLMLPDASSVVLGGPEERRRLLDWGTFHVKPAYLDVLRSYHRILQQRNATLRAARGREANLSSDANTWTHRLSDSADCVDQLRRWYVDRLAPLIDEQMTLFAPDLGLKVSYWRGWPDGSSLKDALGESAARDVKSAATSHGPHRADLRLDVSLGRAAATLSRGQAKIVASAIRLAQARLTADVGGRRCLFLIDDVGAELDIAHNARFFEALGQLGCQVFATATTASPLAGAFVGNRQLFHVEQGSCLPIDTEV